MLKSFLSLTALVIFFFALYQLQSYLQSSKNFSSLQFEKELQVDFPPTISTHHTLFYFGYTSCPDICPTALMSLGRALEKTSDEKLKNLEIYFITLDPDRDTAENLKKYASFFHSKIHGLRLTEKNLNLLTQFFGVKYTYTKSAESNAALSYTVDHSSEMYLLSPDGTVATVFPHGVASETIQEKLNLILKP